MWFFKKKRKTPPISPQLRKIYDDAQNKMKLNYLSPHQSEKVVSNNEDVDFLDEEMKTEMNYPDIDFLSVKLIPKNLKETNTRKDIDAKDVVKAVCLGDIIGYKYEFTPHNYEDVKAEILPPQPSRFTDDTVLSIATVNAVLENQDTPDFRKHYINAYKKYPMAGYGSAFVNWALNENNTKGYHSFGNGCGMRVAFIPAFYEDIEDVIKYTIASVMVTHDHIESIKSTVVLSVCIWMALHNYTKEEIFDYAREHYLYTKEEQELLINKWSHFNLDTDLSTLSNEESKVSLFANYAIPYAIKCFYETESYEDCMREILSHFGDTDTICAIAGGLCFAYYETTNMPIEQILQNNNLSL